MPRLYSLKQQVEQNPQDSTAHAKLADAYHSVGMFAEAEQEFLKTFELGPQSVDFLISQCVNYSEWGKLDETVECYQKVLKQKKHHVLYLSLGDAYEQQGKLDEAIAAFQKSLELKPEFTFSLYQLASLYMKQGRYEEAIQPLQKLISVEPKHIYGNHALGMAFALIGNRTAAMQQYYILQSLDARLAENLLKMIPNQ